VEGPEIRYASSGDVHIAYGVVGDGPIDVVFVSGWVLSNFGVPWQGSAADFYRGMSSFARLILFDKRGLGMSDRAQGIPDLETRMDDIRAVMDGRTASRGRAAPARSVLGTGDRHGRDGFFASFDGPTRAIRCVRAISDGVRELGLHVRAGLHTGECEIVAGKVGGIAVHIGARPVGMQKHLHLGLRRGHFVGVQAVAHEMSVVIPVADHGGVVASVRRRSAIGVYLGCP
jgi:hypothetical protein